MSGNSDRIIDFRVLKHGLMELGLINMNDDKYLSIYQAIDNLNQNRILINDIVNFLQDNKIKKREVNMLRHEIIKVLKSEYLSQTNNIDNNTSNDNKPSSVISHNNNT
eukprot:UN21345